MNRTDRRRFLTAALGLAGVCVTPNMIRSALAQAYPSRPIHYLVGYPPGGTSDVVARAITPGLSSILGQPFVVENRPGGNGIVAADAAAKSAPDGYTLLHTSVSFFTVTPLLTSVPYDPFRTSIRLE